MDPDLILSVMLVFATVGLIVVGRFQWKAISRQADLMAEGLRHTMTAADAAKSSAQTAHDSLVHLNRAFLTTQNWTASVEWSSVSHPLRLDFACEVRNAGRTAARIELIEIATPGRQRVTWTIGTMLVPDEIYPLRIPVLIIEPGTHAFIEHVERKQPLVAEVSGRITYRDAFGLHHRLFARLGAVERNGTTLFALPERAGANDEEDWDQALARGPSETVQEFRANGGV